MGFLVVVVAGYSGHTLTQAASAQQQTGDALNDVVSVRDRSRGLQVRQSLAFERQPGAVPPGIVREAEGIRAAIRALGRASGADGGGEPSPAAAASAAAIDRIIALYREIPTIASLDEREQRVRDAFLATRPLVAELGTWADQRRAIADRATADFQGTARRLSLALIAVVVLVMIVGFGVWIALERLRDRVLRHVDAVGHEQAGLRRVAELVAAEGSLESVLSAVAQELAARIGAGGVWVVRVEGRRGLIEGAAMPGATLRYSLGTVREFPVAPDGVIAHALAGGAPAHMLAQPAMSEGARRMVEANVAAAVAAPIISSGRVWGVVLGMASDRDQFAPGSEHGLEPFARLAGLAITSAEGRATLATRANTDALTGLPNHGAFHERVAQGFAAARDTGDVRMAMALIDIDHLKDVNQRYGHAEGDAVLAAVARRLVSLFPADTLIARVGGEEFGLILNVPRVEDATSVADRARRAISAAPFGRGNPITVSVGVAHTSQVDDPAGLYRAADAALLMAKADGRDCVVTFAPEFLTREAQAMRQRRAERARTLAALRALARAVDTRDPATQRHSERVAAHTFRIAEALGWPRERAELLREAALVHDVGKIGVPDAVLRKPGELTDEEFAQIAAHAALGATIVADVLTREQTAWVRHHHERVDGRGYPDHLRGEDIPEGARIMAIADSWDAMTADRPYRRALSLSAALEECRRASGGQLDSRLVEVALPVLSDAPVAPTQVVLHEA